MTASERIREARELQAESPRDVEHHRDAHRLYRAVRARVALNISPLDELYPDAVAAEFRRRYGKLELATVLGA